MALSAGTRLGPYEVIAAIGKGGMGEVYRATDTRLGRTVAIKILPPDVAATPDLRRRFEQEARAASALNHPHICTLHDIGHDGGTDYLILEYVEGQTLADVIAGRPLPLDSALQYAIDIADALAEAHRHGIVHRDLKPANIIIAANGPKLLDFGLAKQVPIGLGAGVSDAVTAPPAAVSALGMIVGTLQYMAPEQLEGKDADARTDIFAFGAVLYEMLTGRRAFDAPSQPSVIAAIMSSPPPSVLSAQSGAPPALDHLVNRCLSSKPIDRWQSAADIKIALKWIAAAPHGFPAPAATPRKWQLAAAVALAAAVGAFITALAMRDTSVSGGVARFAFAPGHAVADVAAPIAVSRGGRAIAYVSSNDDDQQITLRRIDRFDEQVLAGTTGATSSFFSPDGNSLGFVAHGSIKIVPLHGGSPVTVAEGASDFGADWAPDDTIVFTSSKTWGLVRVPARGGAAETLTIPDVAHGELRHIFPQTLPGGRAVLFSVATGLTFDASRIAAISLDTKRQSTVLDDARAARYVNSGHVLFTRAQRLLAARFDISRLTIGSATPVAESLPATSHIGTIRPFSVSDSGHLVYVEEAGPRHEVVSAAPNGTTTTLGVPLGRYAFPVISPDGRYATLTILRPDARRADIALLDVARRTLTPLTNDGFNHIGIWTPDGERIIFSSARANTANLFVQPRDGSRPAEQLVRSSQHQDPGSCSPDGRLVAYAEADPENKWDLWTVPLTEPRTPKPFRRTPASEFSPMFAPDGKWIAYTSDETGRQEVFVERFPGGGERQQVSSEGGDQALWAHDGRFLFYRSGERVLTVDVSYAGERLNLGVPRVLFAGRFEPAAGQGWPNYSIAQDGSRFLMIAGLRPGPSATPVPTINVVLNWSEELEQLVPRR